MRVADLGDFGRIFYKVDERLCKGLDVIGVATGDDIPVHHHRLIDDFSAGVLQVGPDGGPARRRASLQKICLDEQPGPVANRGNRLALPSKVPDQLDGANVHSQMIGVSNAARQDEGVEIIAVRLIDRQIGPDGLAWIVVNRCLDRLQFGGRQYDFSAALLKNFARTEQLPFLKAVGRDNEDSRFCDQRHFSCLLHRDQEEPTRSARAYAC